jgi:hypothetical protein
VRLSNAKKHAILIILMQRSTMVGIVGLLGSVAAFVGYKVDPESEFRIIEVLLVVTSVTAIVVQPKVKWDGRTDRRTDSSSLGDGGSTGSEGEEGRPRRAEAQGREGREE